MKRRLSLSRSTRGFTLIEVAIAILVAAMGVLAVFALLSSALSSTTKSVADTQSGLFAKDVFGGLRARSVKEAEGGPGDWNDFWDEFDAGTKTVSVASKYSWQNSGEMVIKGNGSVETLVFSNVSSHGAGVANVEDHILVYRLTVGTTNQPGLSPAASWVNRTVTLEVWEGAGGVAGNPIVYYSEFIDPGDL